MRDDADKFTALGAQIVVVARHDEERVREYWADNRLPFAGIPDPEARLGTLYKQQWHALKLGLMPAMFLVQPDGRLAYVYYSNSMADIPSNKKVLDVLRQLRDQPI
jgi:peroxiredoxin